MVNGQSPTRVDATRRSWVRRHWRALSVVAVVTGCVLACLLVPCTREHSYPAYVSALKNIARDYRAELGDYPKSAREAADELGPRMAAIGLELSFLRDDLLLLAGPGRSFEVDYHYVSADAEPQMTYRRR